jgi:hypothetical protein
MLHAMSLLSKWPTALMLCYSCTNAVVYLHKCCAILVQVLCFTCTNFVLYLHKCCAILVQMLCYACTNVVLCMCKCCTVLAKLTQMLCYTCATVVLHLCNCYALNTRMLLAIRNITYDQDCSSAIYLHHSSLVTNGK